MCSQDPNEASPDAGGLRYQFGVFKDVGACF